MALTKRVQQGFLRLPFARKAILVSSAILMVSPLLPWYDNRNGVGIGETFLGIQGPLFLIGVLVLSFGAINFFNMFFPLMGKNFFQLRKRSGITAILLGFQSLFLILIANSIFFHPSFGGEVSKGTRFGMVVAFGAIAVMLLAGFITHKKEKKGENDAFDDFFQNPEAYMPEPEPEPIQAVPTPVASHGFGESSMRSLYSPEETHTGHAYSASPTPGRVSATPSSYSNTMRPSYSAPSRVPSPRTENSSDENVDPLTLDAKTRYKMMRSQQRRSTDSQGNLWGVPQQAADPIKPRINHNDY